MTVQDDLAALADICGIVPHFYDLHGQQLPTSPETQRALLAANGIDVSTDDAIQSSLAQLRFDRDDRWFPDEIIVEAGVEAWQNFGLGAAWDIRLDESDDILVSGEPRDQITVPPLDPGIYTLTATASGRTEVITVIAAPKTLPSVPDLTGATRLWGMNLALYGLRSERNAGLGDFADLGAVAQIAGGQGADFVGINPLHAMGYADQAAISPYSPSHRGYLNTACIALDVLPGAGDAGDFADLRASETVAYQDHKPRHAAALETAFATFLTKADPVDAQSFAAFQSNGGDDLRKFATFEALSEIYGPDWRQWPDTPANPDPARVTFHMWLQWVADRQLSDAQAQAKAGGMALGLYLDLAVGSRRDGAESWCAQTAIAQGVSIGAPPDHLSPAGQNWDLAAFAPRKLKAERYRPLRRIIAQTIRHAGIIRIDHVLGLNRSYWIPDDGSPGGYIHQPFESLLAVIKIDAARYNCAVIGEDLGLVPDGFRDTMRAHGFYGYSVLQYEKDDSGAFRTSDAGSAQVLSCFATHDTPTVKGYETGHDIDWWENLSWVDRETAENMREQRKADVSRYTENGDFSTNVHGMLAGSSACFAAVQLDDVLGAKEAQNLPGTIDEHPNWRRKYDIALEDLNDAPALNAMAALMTDAGR
ncbi:4-alpha-glucanotransferase [Loktanella sp. F6476L]|uniref:4-alpha-glucanotransferase n=1 Tax=Loktanella sp. F6476L TaxID=2926405 RepID=UPI001FF3B5F9|nr:4-alpha-glucanotransferase [Loktanella sp. F6476L]MCK0122724.1 4-alpha-glucanotransferase [Loktanella sp. F6476L]